MWRATAFAAARHTVPCNMASRTPKRKYNCKIMKFFRIVL